MTSENVQDALDELPQVGEYSVILNGKEEAVCVIRTKEVFILPFNEVPESHAFAEGEGDRSLDYWRRVHKEFFEEDSGRDHHQGHPRSSDTCLQYRQHAVVLSDSHT